MKTKCPRAIQYLIIIAFFFTATLIIQGILLSPLGEAPFLGYWSAIRLAWSQSILLGDDLYPLAHGPILSQMYGPVSPFLYLPALFLPSINLAFFAASGISAFLTFLPVFILLRAKSKNIHPSMFLSLGFLLLFCLLTTKTASLRYSSFGVHADAAALGFSALAGWCLYTKKQRQKEKAYFLSALFTVLSIGSKQVMLPIIPALCLYVYITEGARKSLRYLCYTCCFMLLLFMGIIWKSDLAAFFANTVLMPFQTGWCRENRWLALLFVAKEVFDRSWFLFTLLLICLFHALNIYQPKDNAPRIKSFLNDNPWVLFVLVSAFMLPVALLLRVKIGGAENAFSPLLYFLLLSLCLVLHQYAQTSTENQDGKFFRRLGLGLFSFLMVGLIIAQISDMKDPSTLFEKLRQDTHTQAYAYAKKHPGEVYFPINPLSSQLAEGKTYSCLFCVLDWGLGGFNVPPERFKANLPQKMKFIALPLDTAWIRPRILEFLPEFDKISTLDKLPGFVILTAEDPGQKRPHDE